MIQREEIIGDCRLILGLPAVMEPSVFGARHHLKVLKSIIRLVLIDVVDDFVAPETPPKVALHNDAVLSPAGVLAPRFRREGDIAVPVARLSRLQKAVAGFACGLALKASATLGGALPKRPLVDLLCLPAFTSAIPVMQAFPLLCVRNDRQSPKSLPGEVRDFIGASIR